MGRASLFLAHFQPRDSFGIAGLGIIQHGGQQRGLFGGGLLHVFLHPIAHLPVSDGILHDFNHLFVRDPGGLEPAAVEALAEVGLVIGVKFAGEVQTDLVNVTRQMRPAVHGFARAARINDFAHAAMMKTARAFRNGNLGRRKMGRVTPCAPPSDITRSGAHGVTRPTLKFPLTSAVIPATVPPMAGTIQSLGVIAGNRTLPLLFARQARAAGVTRLVAVAFESETDPALASLVEDIVWLRVGQLGKMIAAFTERGVKQCVMVGQIAPKNLFDLRPDLRAMGMLLRLKEKNAHTIFSAIAEELKKEGVELIAATPWLAPLMPGAGFALGPTLSAEQRADVEFGFRIAKEVSRLEIGQTVVVKNGMVLAVEGFEGTDKCLARGGELAGKEGGAVAVKVAKPGHDMRFDIPCIGAQTLTICADAGIAVLALEAGKTLLLDADEVKQLAAKRKISLTTVG